MPRPCYRTPAIVFIVVALTAVLVAQAQATVTTRIINGDKVGASGYAERWPWIAALVATSYPDIYSGQFCAGSLIAPRVVMTAAHCVGESSAGRVDAVIGTSDLSTVDAQRITAIRVRVHPNWNATTFDNDIALIELATPAAQQPVTIVGSADAVLWGNGLGIPASPTTGAWIAGWGNLCSEGCSTTYPHELYEANIPIQSDTTCSTPASGGSLDFHAETMLCAGTLDSMPQNLNVTDGVDTCQGDSGGPLIVGDGAGLWKVAGITSWGEGCAQATYGVYTRVGSVSNWVADELSCGFGTGTSTCPSVKNVDVTPPTTPRSITLRYRTRHAISIRWGRSFDNATLSHFVIYRKVAGHWRRIGTTAASERIFTKGRLPSNTLVRFRVRAVDSSGNISPPIAGSIRTLR